MGHPTSPKETRSLIANLLAAIEDPTNPPTEDERDQLITSANRWLELEDGTEVFDPCTMAEQLRAWAGVLYPYTTHPDLMGLHAGMVEVADDILNGSQEQEQGEDHPISHAYCDLLDSERQYLENLDGAVQVTNDGEDLACRDSNGRDIWALCWLRLPRLREG